MPTDPNVARARAVAHRRARAAGELDELLGALFFAETYDVGAIMHDPALLVGMCAHLATAARRAQHARDLAVDLARTLPEHDRPSWAALAQAMGEADRNNLARRYRKATRDE